MLKSVEGSTPCPDCEIFDLETKRLVQSLFGPEETILLTMLLASVLKERKEMLGRMRGDDIQRLPIQRDLDMFGITLGKLLIATPTDQLAAVQRSIYKRFGLELDIGHESCPHKDTPTPESKVSSS